MVENLYPRLANWDDGKCNQCVWYNYKRTTTAVPLPFFLNILNLSPLRILSDSEELHSHLKWNCCMWLAENVVYPTLFGFKVFAQSKKMFVLTILTWLSL